MFRHPTGIGAEQAAREKAEIERMMKHQAANDAAQEERFTRKKHDPSYPYNSIKYVLDEAKLNLSQIDQIVFYEKPFLKFERLLETYLAFAPRGFSTFLMSMPLWLREKLFQKN